MRLNSLAALYRKELFSSFFSPVFYGTGAFFLFFLSFRFYYLQSFLTMDSASFRSFFSSFPLVYIFVIPALTMKSWAEENKSGSAEILFTMPFTPWELCLGKFLSSFVLLLIYIFLTLPIPLSLLPLGNFDPGVIAAEYAGAVLLGAAAIALGQFFSMLSRSQTAAFLSSVLVLLAFMFTDLLVSTLNLSPLISRCLNFFSLSFHFESFSRGLLDSRDFIFFILSAFLFLFLNTSVLIFRKWN